MRILINGDTLSSSVTGIASYTLQLSEALLHRPGVEAVGVSVRGRIRPRQALTAALPLPSATRRLATSVGEVVPPLGSWTRRVAHWSAQRQLKRVWNDFSLFHEPNYTGPRPRIPLVTTVCDMSFLRYPQCMPRDRQRWLAQLLPQQLRASSAILTISQFTKVELCELCPQVPEDRVFVTPLGVDHDLYRPCTDTRQLGATRDRYRLPPQFILYLGTLEPRKNIDGLLKAFMRLPKPLQREYPLVLAGAEGWRHGVFRPLLEQLRAAQAIQHIGYVARRDIPALMTAATVFCFPSHYEGFGLPPLEAAACGTPVLCSRAGALTEVMADAAHYVDAHSPEAIADGLAHLLADADLRRSLHFRGRQRAAHFTWQHCAEMTLDAYRAALDDAGSARRFAA